jgi:CBS domain-containing protein
MEEKMAISIREIMTTDTVRLPANAPVRVAARVMRDDNIGDVIVEKNGSFCGIVTDRDIVVRAIAAGLDEQADLESICSKDVTTISTKGTDEDAVRLMREKSIRRLPVLDDGKVVGIISLGDLAVKRDPRSVLGRISAAPPNQ